MPKKKKRILNAVEFMETVSDDIAGKVVSGEMKITEVKAFVVHPEDSDGYECTGRRFDCGIYGCKRPDNCSNDFRCTRKYTEP